MAGEDWRRGYRGELATIEAQIFGDLFHLSRDLGLIEAGSALEAVFCRRDLSGLHLPILNLADTSQPPSVLDAPGRAREALTIVMAGFVWLYNRLSAGVPDDTPGLSSVMPPEADRESLRLVVRALERAVAGCFSRLRLMADGLQKSTPFETESLELLHQIAKDVRSNLSPSGVIAVAVQKLRTPEGDRRKKYGALVSDQLRRWPSIERDLRDSLKNGLNAAAKHADHGYWWEAAAIAWASERGKLIEVPGSDLASVRLHRILG